MLFLVWFRTKFIPVTITGQGIEKLKHPIYTIDYKNGELSTLKTSQRVENFMLFSNYTDIFEVGYDSLYDFQSPVYFSPPNCHIKNSIVSPAVSSPIIAIVGSTNQVVQNSLQYMEKIFEMQQLVGVGMEFQFQYYETQSELNAYISSRTYLNPDPGVCFGFQIEINNSSDYDVSLFFFDNSGFGASKGVGIPNQLLPEWTTSQDIPKLSDYEHYSLNGYSFMQNLIATMILRESTGVKTATISMMAIPMKIDQVTQDGFTKIYWMFSNMILFAYLIPMYTMVFYIVKEKESRAKESMRMMGLTDLPYWASWFCYYTIINTFTALLSLAVLCINVISHSNKFYVFSFIWLYGESLFGQIMIIQSLFNKSKFAGIVSTVVYIGLAFFAVPVQHADDPKNLKLAFSFIPEVNIYLTSAVLINFEGEGYGIHSNNAWSEYNNFNFNEGLLLFVGGFFAFLILGIYLDQAIPTEFGQKKHPCYYLMPSSYSCCRRRNQAMNFNQNQLDLNELMVENDIMESKNMPSENYEPVAAEIARQELEGSYLRIQDLEKTYENGFHAVKGLNIKMYTNQIFALLGQNGAGKSTTISMLTGLISNSKGSAQVFDFDMFKEADKVRQFMGVCPQHDILFEFLTPFEHLSIFYDFKGGNPLKKQKEIIDLIRDVELVDDCDKPAGLLSGGSKRKLSVAIAMCAGSRLVLLDEPTAGMDITARRSLWEMLKNNRRDKIIILTTHYMDEADVLGDRIGIMANGQMKCLGSPLFLKNRFGAGYKLSIVKQNKGQNTLIKPYLERNLGEVELISEVSSEISFGIPNTVSDKFREFFKIFDEDLASLEIISYAISITTLEEVFLHINKDLGLEFEKPGEVQMIEHEQENELLIQDRDPFETENKKDEYYNSSVVSKGKLNNSYQSGNQSSLRFSKIITDTEIQSLEPTERFLHESSPCVNIQALLQKRFNIYKRDRVGLACEVIMPFIMVLAGCCLTRIQWNWPSISRVLSPDLYPQPQRILMNKNNVINSGSNDVPPQVLFQNLPYSQTAFQVNYTDKQTFQQFYSDVYEFKNVGTAMPYKFGSYQVYLADNLTQTYQINSFLNLTSQDVSALYPQFMYQSIIKSATGNPNFNIQITTKPFPSLYVMDQRAKTENSFDFAFMVSIGVAMIPCVTVSFILKERQEGLKHIQLISGMNLPAYWFSNFIADVLKMYIPCSLIILTSVAFQVNYPYVWLLFILLPLALVPFSYVTTFIFKNDTSGQIATLTIHFFACAVMGLVVFTMQLLPSTFVLGDKLRWACCIVPTYALINGVLWSSSGQRILAVRQSDVTYPQLPSEILAWQNIGGDVAVLIAHFLIDTLILTLIEREAFDLFQKMISCKKLIPRNVEQEMEDDVKQEELRVMEYDKDVIKVKNFRKIYTASKPIVAVDHLSFGLEFGECFAILGVNGAGKTTTFKCFTDEEKPSAGLLQIQGFNIQKDFNKARKLIGYCPQDNSIFNLLTVKEHLYFFSKLKGIPNEKQKELIDKAIIDLNLMDHRDKPAGTLSGGNKRKLSVGIATLGNPPIILLDEPSAGMDPEARRFMWSAVAKISQRDKQSAVILTTHSMEEAEALSTKMAIMAKGGVFKCFGSAQHIKNKYSTGYEIEVKIQKSSLQNLEILSKKLGFLEHLDDRIDLDQSIIKAKSAGIDILILNQLRVDCLGSDLALEAQQNKNQIRLKNLIMYFYTMIYGFQFINLIAEHFEWVDLYEQCSDFFKVKIPKQGKSTGFLFGIIEDNKKRLFISEYSVSQTSLEQIFQNFVNQSSTRKKTQYIFSLGEFKELVLQSRN